MLTPCFDKIFREIIKITSGQNQPISGSGTDYIELFQHLKISSNHWCEIWSHSKKNRPISRFENQSKYYGEKWQCRDRWRWIWIIRPKSNSTHWPNSHFAHRTNPQYNSEQNLRYNSQNNYQSDRSQPIKTRFQQISSHHQDRHQDYHFRHRHNFKKNHVIPSLEFLLNPCSELF